MALAWFHESSAIMKRRMIYSLTLPRWGSLEFIALIAGVCVHVLTVFLAYRLGGFLSAGLSLVFPIAAQIYWVLEIWDRTDGFWSPFTLMCCAYLLVWVLICAKRIHRGLR
jgi:hypothetical protein